MSESEFDIQQSFSSFVSSLKTDQLFKLQPKLKPTQLTIVFEIVGALQTNKPVGESVILKFLSSVSSDQLKTFKSVLTPTQWQTLSDTHEAASKRV